MAANAPEPHASPDAATGSGAAWPSSGRAWYAVLVMMVAYLFSYVDRQILSMLVGPIKADLGLTDTQVSWLHGLAFAFFFTVFGVWPIGRWADTGNRRNLIAAGIFVWSFMTALCGRAYSFAQLFLARVGVGVGEAALAPAAYSMIADYFPPERRGRALGIFAMGVYLGIGAAIMITGYVVQLVSAAPTVHVPLLGEIRSWQVAFLLVGPPGIAVSLWMLTVREPERRGVRSAAEPSFGEALALVRGNLGFYGNLTLGISLLTLLFNAVAFWIPAYLVREHGLRPLDIALTYGPIMLVFGSAGIVAGGFWADRQRQRGVQDAEVRTGMVSALLLWPVTVAAFQMPTAAAMLVLLAPLLFLSSLPFGIAAAALQLVTPNRLRARVSAIYLLVINLTGIGFGSTAAALLTDYVFRDERRVGDSVSLLAAVAAPLAALVLSRALAPYRSMQRRNDATPAMV